MFGEEALGIERSGAALAARRDRLAVAMIGDIASGQTCARRIDAEGGQSRVDAVQQANRLDTAAVAAYPVQSAFLHVVRAH